MRHRTPHAAACCRTHRARRATPRCRGGHSTRATLLRVPLRRASSQRAIRLCPAARVTAQGKRRTHHQCQQQKIHRGDSSNLTFPAIATTTINTEATSHAVPLHLVTCSASSLFTSLASASCCWPSLYMAATVARRDCSSYSAARRLCQRASGSFNEDGGPHMRRFHRLHCWGPLRARRVRGPARHGDAHGTATLSANMPDAAALIEHQASLPTHDLPMVSRRLTYCGVSGFAMVACPGQRRATKEAVRHSAITIGGYSQPSPPRAHTQPPEQRVSIPRVLAHRIHGTPPTA